MPSSLLLAITSLVYTTRFLNLNNLKSKVSKKIQVIVGEQSFSIVLPKTYAIDLGVGKEDFVKVRQEEGCIIIEKDG